MERKRLVKLGRRRVSTYAATVQRGRPESVERLVMLKSIRVLVVPFLWVVLVHGQTIPQSDPQALALAAQSIAAMTGGMLIRDMTLTANTTWTAGSNTETGTATLRAKGLAESRVDLALSGGTRSDIRNSSPGYAQGAWVGNDGVSHPYAQHNCWTDAVWFFPALSSLTQTSNPSFIFKYIGQEQREELAVQHIQLFQVVPNDTDGLFLRLSTVDFYLDASTYLPLAVTFETHSDHDLNTDISAEIQFANYQTVNGVMVPLHVQKLLNETVLLDVTVTDAVFNAGLSDSPFSLQ